MSKAEVDSNETKSRNISPFDLYWFRKGRGSVIWPGNSQGPEK